MYFELCHFKQDCEVRAYYEGLPGGFLVPFQNFLRFPCSHIGFPYLFPFNKPLITSINSLPQKKQKKKRKKTPKTKLIKEESTGFYYINTNEIPGELSRENLQLVTSENNMLSSHVKISPLLQLHNKSRLSHQKPIKVKWFGISLVFI